MARVAGDYDAFPASARKPDFRIFTAKVAIGATGAPTLTGDEGITISRSGTGTYALVYPAFPDDANVLVTPRQSATIANAAASAISPTAGTATIVTRDFAGAAADPANGDVLQIEISGKVTTAK